MNDDKIGALWENTTGKGQKYLSGQIEIDGKKIRIVAFKNGYKKEDKHPDWNIMISRPKEERRQEPQQSADGFQDDIPWDDKKEKEEVDLF
jgi:hypothetical protein